MSDAKISALPASTTPLAGTEVLPIVQSGATKQVSVANLTAGREVSASTLSVGGTNAPSGFGSKVLVEGGDASIANAFALKLWSSGNNDVNTIKTTGTRQLSVFNNDGSDECLRVTYNRDIQAVAGNFIVGTAGKGIDFSADGQAAGMTSELLDDYEEGIWTPLVAFGGTSVDLVTAVSLGKYTKIGNVVYYAAEIYFSNKGSSTGAATVQGLPFTIGSMAMAASSTTFHLSIPSVNLYSSSGTALALFVPGTGGGVAVTDANFTNASGLVITGMYFI